MPRILPRKFQGACLWLVSLNNNQTRAPSREGGENRERIETLTAGDWAYIEPGSPVSQAGIIPLGHEG